MEATTERLRPVPAVPADATLFTFGAGAAWATLFALTLSIVEILVMLSRIWSTPDPTTRLTQIPVAIFLVFVAKFNWRLYRRSRDRIAVTSEGIWWVHEGRNKYLDWRNVVAVKANEPLQRIELTDAGGKPAIHLAYRLKRFDRLRDLILSYAPVAAQALTPGIGLQPRIAAHPRGRLPIAAGLALALLAGVALIASQFRGSAGRMIDDALASRFLAAPTYQKHDGPVAAPGDLKGSGRVYLVQMGPHAAPYSLDEFAQWLRAKYALDVQVLTPMQINPSAWDANRHRLVAEQLYAQMKQGHSNLASDRHSYLIGFTDGDMYSTREMWDHSFTQRDLLRSAIISTYRMEDTAWERAHLNPNDSASRLQARLRRILLKDVAVLYWHLPVNNDASSLLYNGLDPDLPVEDIFKSDLNPALDPGGEQLAEPCIYFTYSSRDGMQPAPGPLIRNCGSVQDPMEDESVELFELDLRLGLLIDKHTEFYLPDTIPIEFQRVLRDGEPQGYPFGVSGMDNYDEYLSSADNIRILVLHADGGRDELVRTPRWLPILPLVKYVGGQSERTVIPGSAGLGSSRVWQYEMAWRQFPFEHYEVRRFNGGVKSFLPCDTANVYCALVGYRDSQGRELKIERDKNRRLSQLTSPNGNSVGVSSAPDGRIIAIADSNQRTILYGYDDRNRLVSVTYPSGEIYRYEYDNTQHMLTFSISPDAHSEARILLRNEYQHGLLTKQTFANGDVYTYDYDSTDATEIHRAVVHAPNGKTVDIDVTYSSSTVRERLPDQVEAARGVDK